MVVKRSETMWRLHVAASEVGLATGLMTVVRCVGCGNGGRRGLDRRAPQYLRLVDALAATSFWAGEASLTVWNPYAFAAFGMYGFVLVPTTYIATWIWTIRHPPLDRIRGRRFHRSDMRLVLYLGAISFTTFIIGHMLSSMRLTALEQRLAASAEHAGRRRLTRKV